MERVRRAIENYLTIISAGGMDEATRIRQLIGSLDELAHLYHQVQCDGSAGIQGGSAPLDANYGNSYKTTGALFPSLGYYNTAMDITSDIGGSSVSVGDAIDDIVDIARDLQDVIWRYENTSSEDALRLFKGMFRHHWGTHMRHLQLYLHSIGRDCD